MDPYPLPRKDSNVSTDSSGGLSSSSASSETAPTTTRSDSPRPKLATLTELPESVTAAGSVKNICFVGAGFVGGPTAALIAYHNPGMAVHVVDLNEARVAAWSSAHLPIYEAGLDKIVRVTRDGTREAAVPGTGGSTPHTLPARTPNLFFSTAVEARVAAADIVFLCVNTPTKTYGVGAGASADLGFFEAATVTVAKHLKPGAIVVEKSTVPCGTARMIAGILEQYRPGEPFEVLNNPEFLSEGTAVEDLMRPDRVLIGSAPTAGGRAAAAVLTGVYGTWVSLARVLRVDTFSSELAKLLANAMLAQRVSSVNAASAMCEELGADVGAVSRALGADSRIGGRFLQAGIGFGGSCFEKDIRNVAWLARALRLDAVADYWLAVLRINEAQRVRFAAAVLQRLRGSLGHKKVAVLGFAFKESTNDTRNSVAVHVIAQLAAELPREIAVFDPGCAVADVEAEIRAAVLDLAQQQRIRVHASWSAAVAGAAAVCVLTPWEHFATPSGAAEGDMERVGGEDNGEDGDGEDGGDGKDGEDGEDGHHSHHGHHGHADGPPPLSEMHIRSLERRQRHDDPFGRLLPRPACALDCARCQAASTMPHDVAPVDWVAVRQAMGEAPWVFDGRSIVDPAYLRSLGFHVHSIGRGLGEE